MAAAKAFAAILSLLLTWHGGRSAGVVGSARQHFLSPGQKATSLTVTNQGKSETAIQIRAFAWSQQDGRTSLTATDEVVASPPLATIAPGATQVVRLILRQSPQKREATYRILLDQIPPPAEPGVVHIVLRMSIPIFAQPAIRSFADVQFHLERNAGQLYLVGYNAGNLHESIRDIVLYDKRWPQAERGLQHIALHSLRRHAALAHCRAGFPASVKRNLAIDCPRERRRHQRAGSLCSGAMILYA